MSTKAVPEGVMATHGSWIIGIVMLVVVMLDLWIRWYCDRKVMAAKKAKADEEKGEGRNTLIGEAAGAIGGMPGVVGGQMITGVGDGEGGAGGEGAVAMVVDSPDMGAVPGSRGAPASGERADTPQDEDSDDSTRLQRKFDDLEHRVHHISLNAERILIQDAKMKALENSVNDLHHRLDIFYTLDIHTRTLQSSVDAINASLQAIPRQSLQIDGLREQVTALERRLPDIHSFEEKIDVLKSHLDDLAGLPPDVELLQKCNKDLSMQVSELKNGGQEMASLHKRIDDLVVHDSMEGKRIDAIWQHLAEMALAK
ncbi:hypothetical protein HOY80DRAFT_1046876 [Tuber brumale]|nr:hypothetical protein HOY80DRAFT_1046876 [Tuber brumale]